MDARLQIDRSRTAARQALVAKRLAGRTWERRRSAAPAEPQTAATPILAGMLERFTTRTGGSADQFARYLPRLLDELRQSDPALVARVTSELALIFANNAAAASPGSSGR